MRIRILNTTFGLVVDGIVKPKSPKDPPFEVDEKLGLRIVREGIAEAVDGAERGEVQSESNDNDNAESAGDDFGIPQYSADTSKADLQSIANEYGIEVSAAATSRNSSRRLTTFSPTRCPMIRRANNGL
ncbi:MAG: hypothetical protein ACLSG5_09845 [Oscillospiraceae bacterium]